MELIVLGAGGSWAGAGGGTSGYLLRHDGFNVLMDLGSGTLGRLQQHITPADVHGVLVSHEHPDHFVDLYMLFYARFYGEQGSNGLPLYAPVGFFDLATRLVSPESRDSMEVAYDLREVEPGEGFQLGPLTLETRQMEHFGIPSLGFRVEADGAVLAYSGDTGPTDALVELARGADVLLCEATLQDADDLPSFHLSARQAAEHAARAGVGRLVLTHIWPSFDAETSRSQAAEAYPGPIDLAFEGMRLPVGG